MLECVEFSQRHTVENLQIDLERVFTEWHIQQKIITVVSDNAANIKAAVKLRKWKHVGYFAHSLNLVVQNAIQDVDYTKI